MGDRFVLFLTGLLSQGQLDVHLLNEAFSLLKLMEESHEEPPAVFGKDQKEP